MIETYSTLDWGFSDIGADCPVLISEVVDFESEWRTYVVEDKIVGIKNYKGDEFLVPSKEMVLKMISAYTSAPKSYSLDVGIVKGKTLLVECNDGWALGNYGLDSALYANFLMKRWLQLMEQI